MAYNAYTAAGSENPNGTVAGPAGKSAYQLAVEAGFVGTLDEWLASLEGADGADGSGTSLAFADEGTALPAQPLVDFVGEGVTVTDDPVAGKTVVMIPGGGGDGTSGPHSHAEYVETTDPRLSDARSPTAHGHTIGHTADLQAALDGKVGTDDPRLSDARASLTHSHPEYEGAGEHTHDSYVETTDPRLSDARTPTAHEHAEYVATDDPRLSDARTPTAHGHAIADVNSLAAELAARKPVVESTTEPAGDVVWVNPERDTAHTHSVDEVTGRPAAVLRATSGQAFGNGQLHVAVVFGEAPVNDGLGWSASTPSTWTCPKSGLWRITVVVPWPLNANGGRIAEIRVNGTLRTGCQDRKGGAGNTDTVNELSRLVDLVAGDTVQLIGFQTAGVSLTTLADAAMRAALHADWVAP